MLSTYLEAALTPLFGSHHYRRRFEFARSRGHIHLHLFSICADNHPNRLLRELGRVESQEAADARAKWAWGTLSLTAPHPADTPEIGLDLPNVRVPDGEWARRQDSNDDAHLFREEESPRARHIACANSYSFHGCAEYFARPPGKAGRRASLPAPSSGNAEWERVGMRRRRRRTLPGGFLARSQESRPTRAGTRS